MELSSLLLCLAGLDYYTSFLNSKSMKLEVVQVIKSILHPPLERLQILGWPHFLATVNVAAL